MQCWIRCHMRCVIGAGVWILKCSLFCRCINRRATRTYSLILRYIRLGHLFFILLVRPPNFLLTDLCNQICHLHNLCFLCEKLYAYYFQMNIQDVLQISRWHLWLKNGREEQITYGHVILSDSSLWHNLIISIAVEVQILNQSLWL